MAKKRNIIEEPVASEIVAELKIDVTSNPAVSYSPCAFGAEFCNWKNYIESDLEKMKKNFYPKLGSLVKDYDQNSYRINDIELSTKEKRENGEVVNIPLYIIKLSIVQ